MLDIKKGVFNHEVHKTATLSGNVNAVTTAKNALSEQERNCVVGSCINSYTNNIQTKRITMSNKRTRASAFWILKRLIVLILALSDTAAVCYSQDMVNSGTINNTGGGVIRIKGSMSTAGQSTYSGKVTFYGAAQTIPAATFDTLITNGSGAKTLSSGKTVVLNNIIDSAGTITLTASASDTLELQKQGAVPITVVSGSVSANTGAVVSYTQPNQVIYGTNYSRLSVSGGGVKKTTSGAITVTNTLKIASASDSVDFGTNAFTGTGVTFANSGVLQTQGSMTLGSTTTVNGTVAFNSSNPNQTVANAIYSGTLNVSGGTKTIGDLTIGDQYVAAGGARTYTGTVRYGKAGDQTIVADGYSTLVLGGSGTKTFSGTTIIGSSLIDSVNTVIAFGTTTSLSSSSTAVFYNNLTTTGTFDASASGTTVTFAGGSQSISGTSIAFNNLTLSGTAAKTSSVDLSVAGTFTPTRGINMGSTATLAITNSSTTAIGAYGGGEEVIGNLQRSISSTGSFYRFNNDSTGITFTTATPSSFTMRVDSGTAPYSYDASLTVNRKITASYSSWSSGTAALKLAYKYSERPTGGDDTLKIFKYDGGITRGRITATKDYRKMATSSVYGTLTYSSIAPGTSYSSNTQMPSGSQVIMSLMNLSTIIYAGASGAWNVSGTWVGGLIPGLNDDVQIPASYTVTATAPAEAASVAIAASGGLTLQSSLKIYTSLTNSGTIDIRSGQMLQVAANGTGTLTNNSGATIDNKGLIQIGN